MKAKSIDWAQYDDEDLERFIRELKAEQQNRKAEKRRALKAQISDMVKAQGISLSDLFPQSAKPRGRPKGKAPGETPNVKYRNPDNPGQTWTGTGRKPAWFVEALSSGNTLEDLAV